MMLLKFLVGTVLENVACRVFKSYPFYVYAMLARGRFFSRD
jgi:hypothetical protein